MDFRAAHVYVGDVVNHSSSTNSLTLYQRSVDNSFGISVDGNSIGYALSKTMVDARHYAIRILVERGLIETIGKYLGVPYWRCFPENSLQTAVAFDDVVKTGGIEEFVLDQPVLAQGVVAGRERSGKTVDGSAPDAEQAKQKQPEELPLDPRDHELIWSVASDFLFAEYLENNSRKRRPRPDNTVQINLSTPPRASDLRRFRERERERIEAIASSNQQAGDDRAALQPTPYPGRQITIKGRHDKLNELVRHYQQQITSYRTISERAVLKDVTRLFIEYGVLDHATARSPMHVYLALWLNLPVRRGDRWIH